MTTCIVPLAAWICTCTNNTLVRCKARWLSTINIPMLYTHLLVLLNLYLWIINYWKSSMQDSYIPYTFWRKALKHSLQATETVLVTVSTTNYIIIEIFNSTNILCWCCWMLIRWYKIAKRICIVSIKSVACFNDCITKYIVHGKFNCKIFHFGVFKCKLRYIYKNSNKISICKTIKSWKIRNNILDGQCACI